MKVLFKGRDKLVFQKNIWKKREYQIYVTGSRALVFGNEVKTKRVQWPHKGERYSFGYPNPQSSLKHQGDCKVQSTPSVMRKGQAHSSHNISTLFRSQMRCGLLTFLGQPFLR